MQNPILATLNGRAPMNPQINPQLQQIMAMVQRSNMTPKDFYYMLARQKGVDPEQFLKSIQPAQVYK